MATGQAEALPVMLTDVLHDAGVSAREVDRIAVPFGPGSFTGVRIGIAAARAFKLATGADLVACSSLEVIARGVLRTSKSVTNRPEGDQDEILIAMDARRGEAYMQVFSSTPDCTAKTDPQLLPIPEAARICQANAFFAAGTAAQAIADVAKDMGRVAHVMCEDGLPDARDLAQRAVDLSVRETPLTPVYLRPPDAKPPKRSSVQRISTEQET